jgi:ABC-type glycerol-3-phosphate transport system permease component
MSMPRAPTPALVWLGRVLAYAVLALFTLGVVYALAAVVFDSLKSQNEFFTNPWGWPRHLDFRNYSYAWNQAHTPGTRPIYLCSWPTARSWRGRQRCSHWYCPRPPAMLLRGFSSGEGVRYSCCSW